MWPTRVTAIVGALEMIDGLGYSLGPTVGGFLYELGGYHLPFTVIGVILLLSAILGVAVLPKHIGAWNLYAYFTL